MCSDAFRDGLGLGMAVVVVVMVVVMAKGDVRWWWVMQGGDG